MFKPTLFKKLFLVLLLCMLTISGTLLLSVHWSFSRGFGNYLLQAEATQLDKLVTALEQEYAKQGSWQNLQNNPHAWIDLLAQNLAGHHLPPRLHEHPHPPAHHGPPPTLDAFNHPPPPPDSAHFGPPPGMPPLAEGQPEMLSRFLGSRLQLLDADKNKVVGLVTNQEQGLLRPLIYQQHQVGWLSLQASDLINDHLAQLFVKQQIRNNYRIAALVFCLAVLGAMMIARSWVQPLKRLATGTKALTHGDYQTQIPESNADELGQLAQDFNQLARTLSNNEVSRKHWIADISHELRTPLAILRGEIEAVQDGVREFSPNTLHSFHHEVINLSQLVDDLYELSLSDLGNSHYQQLTIDLDECIQEVVQSFKHRFQEKDLSLRYDNQRGHPLFIKGDARRLRQLFVNLLENSCRYTQSGGFCEITAMHNGQHVEINIIDSTPGVPDWALSKLFDRLYRVDKSRNRELGGAGLGLAICQAIVQAHQGGISAFHAPSGGLGVKISLPLLRH